MGEAPISHRQEPRQQRIIREANGSVACARRRIIYNLRNRRKPMALKTFAAISIGSAVTEMKIFRIRLQKSDEGGRLD